MKRTYLGFLSGLNIDSRAIWRAGLLVAGIFVAGIAHGAEDSWKTHPYLEDTWNFQLSIFYPDVSTTASLSNSALGRGTQVNFEDDLDLTDRKALGAILGSVRLGERWRIEAEYFGLNRSGSRALSKTINWGDNTYTVGTVVSSSFDSDVYRLSGGYSFIKNDKSEIGVALGLFVTDFKASLSASGIGATASDTLAPLPTIGVYGAYAFTPRWLVSGRVDYFTLNYEDYDGSLTNAQLQVDYRFTRHFGAGVGYRFVRYDLEVTDNSWNGSVEYKFQGPTIYGVVSF